MPNGRVAATTMGLVLALATGCTEAKKERQAKADAKAAAFVPPAVTSRVDYGSMMDRRFRRFDRNGDDYVDGTEWPRGRARLAELDIDRDGKVSAFEWSEGMIRRFDQMDLNRDSVVTSEEQSAWREARRTGRPIPAPAASALGDGALNVADPAS